MAAAISIAEELLQHGYSDGEKHDLAFYESLAEKFNSSPSRLDLQEALELYHKETRWKRGQFGEAIRTTLDDVSNSNSSAPRISIAFDT